jgi:hypothetical protein
VTDEIPLGSDLHSRWESILAELDIQSVPIHLLKSITITMMDGSEKIFEVEEYIKKGLSSKEVETLLEDFVEENDEEIDTLDFHLNIEALAEEVGEKTKRLLG